MTTPVSSSLFDSLGHALSGSAGTVISTAATYPLDLVNTRLKVQRQLRADGCLTTNEEHRGVWHAFRAIYSREGGSAAFVGLHADIAKSVADSFLFFLFYNLFRSHRLMHGTERGIDAAKKRPRLSAVEELVVGAMAGACARLFTTPIGNVVTRRQTASLLEGREGGTDKKMFREVLAEIRREKGVLGLWTGYSASLVLTLNASITYFVQRMLEQRWMRRYEKRREEPTPATLTFVLAAVSKAIATVVTYPFQIAKARVLVSVSSDDKDDKDGDLISFHDPVEKVGEGAPAEADESATPSLAQDTIFATIVRIGRKEGLSALYDGASGEVVKAFFSHGITMLSKDVVHKLLFQLCFAILAILRTHPETGSKFLEAAHHVSEGFSLRQVAARNSQAWRDRRRAAKNALSSSKGVITNVLDGGQRGLIR